MKAASSGSRGSTVVTGPQIRARLGLRDTWFYVRRVTTDKRPREARTLRGARPLVALHGTIDAPGMETVRLQRRTSGGWKTSATLPGPERRLPRPRRHSRHLPRDGGLGARAGRARRPARDRLAPHGPYGVNLIVITSPSATT